VQTFLPYPDFAASAAVLDDKRLGKQRVETYQILRALTWPKYGWKNHPAVRMWRGFTPALVRYGIDVCDAWEARGYADATREAILAFTGGQVPPSRELREQGRLPQWLGAEAVHVSHRSALLRKDPEHYRRFFPTEPDDLPYFWPPAAFPRWPVRRGRHDALPLATALALLGLAEPLPEQETAILDLQEGKDAEVALPPGGGRTTAGLLAGLCTPGTTLWLTRPHPHMEDPPELPEPVRADRGGKVSAPIAKPPTELDLAAMADEARSEPEFHFLAAYAEIPALGLVVLDDVERDREFPVPALTLRTTESG
jgi:Pyrimidine dimer DNA glycosylase